MNYMKALKLPLLAFTLVFSSFAAHAADYFSVHYAADKPSSCRLYLSYYDGDKNNLRTCRATDSSSRRAGDKVKIYCSGGHQIRHTTDKQSQIGVDYSCSTETLVTKIRACNNGKKKFMGTEKFAPKNGNGIDNYVRDSIDRQDKCYREFRPTNQETLMVVNQRHTGSLYRNCNYIYVD